MKKIIQLFTVILFVALSFGSQAQNKSVQTTTFECNLDCQSCETKIMRQIPYEKGVKDVKVDLENKQVTVKYKKKKNTDEQLIKAFKKIGYTAVIHKDTSKPDKEKKAPEN